MFLLFFLYELGKQEHLHYTWGIKNKSTNHERRHSTSPGGNVTYLQRIIASMIKIHMIE